MGCDCYNYLPPETVKSEIVEFLEFLGYKRESKSQLTSKSSAVLQFNPGEYKYFEGVYAEIDFDQDEGLTIHTHTSIWRSRCDTDFHNYTVKQLKKRFGGHFISDDGKNRYLTNDTPYMQDDEAGCHQAYSKYFSNIQRASYTIYTWLSAKTDMNWSSKVIGKNSILDYMNPLVATVNMSIPFLVSIIEDYFRSTYVALLKYSPRKEIILRNCRIQGEDLISLSQKELTVEEAISRLRSFQNIKRIGASFKELDENINLFGTLKKPYGKHKESIYNTIEKIIEIRHRIIHQAELVYNYTPETLQHDIFLMHKGIERFYFSLINLYKWYDGHPDLHSKPFGTR